MEMVVQWAVLGGHLVELGDQWAEWEDCLAVRVELVGHLEGH